ncbi:unnamed protein product [Clonostachys chloroleuca]|uniref:Uncharacterized protein n=1 Tax=Clonostachys chloroleuca TaxID=1926264 RepID=A0AA35M4X3_9HYPO|nr:unnamed protein product [Clonostachys chloroleuca]
MKHASAAYLLYPVTLRQRREGSLQSGTQGGRVSALILTFWKDLPSTQETVLRYVFAALQSSPNSGRRSGIFPTAAVVATTPRDLDRLVRVDEVRVAQAIVAGSLLPRHAVGRNAAQGVVGPDSPAAAAADPAEPAVVVLQDVVQVEGAVPQPSVGAPLGLEDASVFKVHVL